MSDDSLHKRNRLAHEVARRAIEYRQASVQHEEGDLPEAFVIEAAERLDEAVRFYEVHEEREDSSERSE